MPIQDTDNLIVGRGSNTYKIEYSDLKDDINTGADLQAVTDNGNTTTNGIEVGGGDIKLNADGSAYFVGEIQLQGALSTSSLSTDGGDFVVKTVDAGGGYVERLRIEDGDGDSLFAGRVGIGTSSPNAELQVGETSVNSARSIRIKNNDNTGTAVKAQLELLTNRGTSTVGATNSGKIILNPVGGEVETPGDVAFNGTWGNPASIPVGRLGGGNGLTYVGGSTASDGVALYDNSFDPADKTVSIKTNGSAEFAGKVTANSYDLESLPALQP